MRIFNQHNFIHICIFASVFVWLTIFNFASIAQTEVQPEIISQIQAQTPQPQKTTTQIPYNKKTLILNDEYNEHYLSPYLYQYKAGSNSTLNDIIRSAGEPIIKDSNPNKIVYISPKDNTTWLGFSVFQRIKGKSWGLNLGTTTTGRFGIFDHIEVFALDENLKKKKSTLRNGIYPLPLNNDVKTHVFIKLTSESALPAMLPIKLVETAQSNYQKRYNAIHLLIAVLTGMAFFFLAVSFLQSNYSFLAFSLYYGLLILILCVQNNLFSFNVHVDAQTLPLMYFFLALSALMTARVFWNVENQSRFMQLIFNIIAIVTFILVLNGLYGIDDNSPLKVLFTYGPVLFLFLFIPIVSFFFSQYAQNETTPFMFGWFILLFGILIAVLPFLGIMQPVSTAINAYWFALIPQAFFFIVATKAKISSSFQDFTASQTMQIDETDSVSRLREKRENSEQERLLKVIEQERKVLTQLRKSEAKRTEEMGKAKELADQANKAKSAFLAVVTHEIRTPMTGIMGMVRLLLESNLSKEQKTYAQTIQDSSDAMLALLNDILDFEKIEQGKMSFETITFDLPRVIQGIATLMNGHAVQKNIELVTKIGENLPRYVKGDPTRLRQVLLNLTGNAVKFTDKGHVTITVERIENQKAPNNKMAEIYFSVQDSGIGISREAQENLFTPFSQANTSIARKFGGTGLGLAISKGLVEAMGSEININSNEGEGSNFFFILEMPIGSSSGEQESQETSKEDITEKVDKKHILVVDDNDINLNVVKGLLAKYDHDIKTVNSAEKAIEIVKNEKFDLILMDIEMPAMKGDEATQRIHSDKESLNQKTPVIALTGNLMPDQIAHYKRMGMIDVLEKPIEPSNLIDMVNKDHEAPTSTSTSTKNTPKIKQEEEKLDPPPITSPIEPEETLSSQNTGIQENKIAIDEDAFENVALSFEDDNAPISSVKPEPKEGETIPVENKISVPEENTDIDTTNAIDPEVLVTLKQHLKDNDIKEMVNDVIEKSTEIVGQIIQLQQNKDFDGIKDKCHELRGMAGNFGLVELSETMGRMETDIKNEQFDTILDEVTKLEIKEKRAKKALSTWMSENLS